MLKSFLPVFCLLCAIAAIVFTGGGCASIVPPSGGPRDTLPPTIVHLDPPSETKYFNKNKITLTFNEYVDLEDAYKNLVISPVPKIFPEVQRKLNTVTVKLKDSLLPNTTYVFNFAKTVKDINESNKVKDLLYIFSTGDYFDSLQLSGNVKIAETGKPDSTLTVMLHTNLDDSAVVKEKPKYIARLDSAGTFLFRYLAPGTYRIYALKDDGGSYVYASKEQIFAFADSPVVITAQPPEPIKLMAYSLKEEKELVAPEPDKKEKRLKYSLNLEGTMQDLLQPFTMTFESPLKNFDTSKMLLTADTLFNRAPGYSLKIDSTRKKVTLNIPWAEKKKYALILQKDFASDSLNRELLKTDTLKFTTKSKNDYGQVKITFINLDLNTGPVLQILQSGTVLNSFPLKTYLRNNILELQLYRPGEYQMQLLYDRNNNGKWDPGEFFKKHTQPEIIRPLDKKLNVKPNWTAEFEIR